MNTGISGGLVYLSFNSETSIVGLTFHCNCRFKKQLFSGHRCEFFEISVRFFPTAPPATSAPSMVPGTGRLWVNNGRVQITLFFGETSGQYHAESTTSWQPHCRYGKFQKVKKISPSFKL